MFINCFVLFLVIAVFDPKRHVQAGEPVYECYSWGDPHVQTWHQKGDDQIHSHNCYTYGFNTLVKNEFVYYKVQVRGSLAIEIDLKFYDGTSKTPFCVAISEDFEIHTDGNCAKHGITWNSTVTATEFIVNIHYPKANFLTSIMQYLGCQATCHYNIYVWQPKSLALRSKGICERGNYDCIRALEEPDLEPELVKTNAQKLSITRELAQVICNKHVNAFLKKTRRTPYQRNTSTNDTIANVLAGCIEDLVFTGQLEMARSGLDVLLMDILTSDMTSIDSIQNAFQSGAKEALEMLTAAVEETEGEVLQMLGLTTTTRETTSTSTTTQSTTTTAVTTAQVTTTSPVPLAAYKCAIYQDVYIQTWHPANQALPPSRTCLGSSQNFELVRNKYVRFTLRTAGSVIDELTLRLFDETTANVICTVSFNDQGADWMDCEQNGINPSSVKTATHTILTIYYAKANFTAIVTEDIGINVGRFNINIYQNPDLAAQSTGVCSLLSSCAESGHVQSKKRFRRGFK